MDTQQWVLVAINLVGGTLVIASYVHGLLAHPTAREDLWGSVPNRLRRVYTTCMLLAAAGYFAFTYYVLFVLEPEEVEIFGSLNYYWLFHILYALILFPSALWMPLTFAMIRHPSQRLWWTIRITLSIVGLASLCMLGALLSLDPRETTLVYWFAVAGSATFCIQTALLDAVVWPAFPPR